MTTAYSPPPPPLRDLPPGHLDLRKQHLLTEVARDPRRGFSLSGLVLPRGRVIAALGGLSAATAAVILGLTLADGSRSTAAEPFLVQAIRGPAWSTYAPNWGGRFEPSCASVLQVPFGCDGMMRLRTAAREPKPTPPAPKSPRETEIVGGTAQQQSRLRSIIDNMRPTAVTKIAIRPSNGGVALRMEAPDASMRTLWEETLIASAFRDQAKLADDPTAVSLENGESSGLIPPGPVSALPAAKPRDIEDAQRTFTDAAAMTSAALEDLTIYRPSGVAVAVTLKTEDPASYLLHEMPRFLAALGNLWRDYDGIYVRLIDSSAATAWETSVAGRTSTGGVGSRADLAGCSPVANWGPTPAPCPAG